MHALFEARLNLDWVYRNSVIIHYRGRNKPWKENYVGQLDVSYIDQIKRICILHKIDILLLAMNEENILFAKYRNDLPALPSLYRSIRTLSWQIASNLGHQRPWITHTSHCL